MRKIEDIGIDIVDKRVHVLRKKTSSVICSWRVKSIDKVKRIKCSFRSYCPAMIQSRPTNYTSVLWDSSGASPLCCRCWALWRWRCPEDSGPASIVQVCGCGWDPRGRADGSVDRDTASSSGYANTCMQWRWAWRLMERGSSWWEGPESGWQGSQTRSRPHDVP